MNSVSATQENKIKRKQKRCQHTLEKETGIIPRDSPTKVIIFLGFLIFKLI